MIKKDLFSLPNALSHTLLNKDTKGSMVVRIRRVKYC